MPLTASNSDDGHERLIRLPERFDFGFHGEFRKAYQTGDASRFVLDMRDTSYMDSSALGMLLQLREHAGQASGAIRVININPGIKEILKIANFDKLFTLE